MADYQEQIELNISLAEKRKNITYDGLDEEDNLKQLINELREVVPKLEPPISSAGERSTEWSHVVKFPDSLEVEEKREALFPTRDGKLLGISPSHDNLILYRYIYCKINHSIPVYPYKIDGITITGQIHEFTGDDDKSRGLIIEMSLIRYEEDGVSIIDDWQIASDKEERQRNEPMGATAAATDLGKPKRKGRMTAEQQESEQLAQRLAGNGGIEDDSDDD
jgi:hypothetical protein